MAATVGLDVAVLLSTLLTAQAEAHLAQTNANDANLIAFQMTTAQALVANLAGNVTDMLATCRPNSQMSALSADTALSCRHKTDPDTAFLCWGWRTFTPFFF